MKKYIKICIAFIFLCVAVSCNNDEVFQREQYKNVFALISGTDNVSTWTHDLRKTESEGYVSASLGGSNPSTTDIRVTLVEDPSLIDEYNVIAFDVNTSKYIQPLSREKYTIDTYEFTIPAGAVGASIPIKIRPAGLSPDSSYFIALKVNSYTAYEVNPEKDYLLYQVRIKNWWAAYGGTGYRQMGTRVLSGSSNQPTQIFGSKNLYPLSPNKVRVMAGNELNDQSSMDIFERYSMVITIDDNSGKASISSYKKLEVNQIDGDPDYPNTVMVESDRFNSYKTFLLCYSYKAPDGQTYTMKEELRLEFREDPADPRFLTQ